MRHPLILIPLAIAELLPCVALAAAQEPAQAVRLDSQDQPAISEHNRKDTAEIGSLSPATRTPPDFQVTAPPAELNLDSFYKKSTRVRGYPIVASGNVNDYALKEAAYLIDMLTARRSDLLETMVASGSRLCILGYNEFTTDLPEFAHLQPRDHWDARARGTGGSQDDPYCSCGEENLLGYPGDPYAAECILIHEFAHNIHLRGLVTLDPTFDDRLKGAYQTAMGKGLWQGKYASVNHHEYFAEGVQSWFDNNRPPDHDHNHVDTRQELVEYDPGLAAICREVFGATELKYTKPATRLHGHLGGYNPADAPVFAWPKRLNEQRSYQRRNGVFGPVSVERPMLRRFSAAQSCRPLGYGALELTARFACLDYSDPHTPAGPQGQLVGILLPQVTIGVNWYLVDRLRLMFNYSYVQPNTGVSSASVFASRLGMYW